MKRKSEILPKAVHLAPKFNEAVSDYEGWAVKTVNAMPEAVLLGHRSYIEHTMLIVYCKMSRKFHVSYIVEATPGQVSQNKAGRVVHTWQLSTPWEVDSLLAFFASSCNVDASQGVTGFENLDSLLAWKSASEESDGGTYADRGWRRNSGPTQRDWERFRRGYRGTRLYAAAAKAGFSSFLPTA